MNDRNCRFDIDTYNLFGIVAEQVDATDLKSVGHCGREGSIPSVPTICIFTDRFKPIGFSFFKMSFGIGWQ